MSKLADKAKTSKLKINFAVDNNAGKKESVIKKIKPIDFPRSYRFDYETMNTLKNMLDKINEYSPKKISEARLIKALIFLSTNISEDKLLKALKEVW